MYVLALDTSTLTGSVALFLDRQLLDQRQWTRQGSHSELLTFSVQEILKKGAVSINQIDRIAVGIGPGSFTGIRVAVNFARTLGYTLKIPIFTLNSLHLLASQAGPMSCESNLLVMQYAFRDLVYIGEYKIEKDRVLETTPPMALTVAEIEGAGFQTSVVLGTGFDAIKGQVSQQTLSTMVRNSKYRDYPLAEDFAQSPVLDESCESALSDWIHTIPLYIRASEAEEKLKRGLLKPV